MKRLALPTLALALALATGATAFADFIAGRVRPGFKSDMTTTQSSGVYRGVERGLVTLNFEDGKAAPVSITVSLPNFKQGTTLPIREIKKSDCGDRYVAYNLTQSLVQSSFELVDYSHASCEIFMEKTWHVSVKQTNGDRVLSELDLAGNPDPIFVTL